MAWNRRAEDYPYFDNGGLPIGYAHRGGALSGDSLGLENSMRAFEAAVSLGYGFVETDAHVTRDGRLLAFHDRALDRLTDGRGRIADLEYADVAKARIGGSEPIPLLSDLLTAWPGLHLNIDAKSAPTVPPLARCIVEHKAWERVCVASFSPYRLSLLRRLLGPRVASSYSAIGVGALRLAPTSSLRKVLDHAGVAAQVPVRRGRLEIVTADFVSRAHELGKHVHVWTIDVPDEMNRLLDLGVDAIMTDRIDVLRDVYVARGIWRG